MTNLLQQAIDCNDADRAAKIIRGALGIECDDVVTTASRRPGRTIASGAPATSSGSRPRRAIWPDGLFLTCCTLSRRF
jgi:hypothetical protein